MSTGLVFDIQKYSIHAGPGIRTTVFFKGCPLTCWWCHNPESRGREPFVHYDGAQCLGCLECVDACPEGALSAGANGIVTDVERCGQHGTCAATCPAEARRLVGRRTTVSELMDEVEADRLYYDQSGGGVTFSGGEPLAQWRFLLEALAACREREFHRVVDTTGFAAPDVLMRVARETDLFLYDLKVMDPELHLRSTGVPLRPILNNLVRLLSGGARVQIRIPLIPGVTTDEGIEQTADFLGEHSGVEGVRLVPFHRSAKDKHRKFGVPWLMETDEEIPRERVDRWVSRFRLRGIEASSME